MGILYSTLHIIIIQYPQVLSAPLLDPPGVAWQTLPVIMYRMHRRVPNGDFETAARKAPIIQHYYGFLYYGYKPTVWWAFVVEFVGDWLVGFQAMFVNESLAFHFIFMHVTWGKY